MNLYKISTVNTSCSLLYSCPKKGTFLAVWGIMKDWAGNPSPRSKLGYLQKVRRRLCFHLRCEEECFWLLPEIRSSERPWRSSWCGYSHRSCKPPIKCNFQCMPKIDRSPSNRSKSNASDRRDFQILTVNISIKGGAPRSFQSRWARGLDRRVQSSLLNVVKVLKSFGENFDAISKPWAVYLSPSATNLKTYVKIFEMRRNFPFEPELHCFLTSQPAIFKMLKVARIKCYRCAFGFPVVYLRLCWSPQIENLCRVPQWVPLRWRLSNP